MPTTPNPPRHETRALLRAHLAAAARYGHATRHCPVCHRLQLLAMEPADERPRARTEPSPEVASEVVTDSPPLPSALSSSPSPAAPPGPLATSVPAPRSGARSEAPAVPPAAVAPVGAAPGGEQGGEEPAGVGESVN
ncbi:DUF6274 family protein [Streptomyces macrosporus]|uniref:Uncharacterized protein n=1 Tax=Streptomyces macrosporus TaxID=44032 RepID=A0ABN3KK32_9ACTN